MEAMAWRGGAAVRGEPVSAGQGRHMLPMSPPPAFSYAPPDSSNLTNLHITTRVVQPQQAFFAARLALVSTFDLILCEDSYHSWSVTRRSRLLFIIIKITVPPFHASCEGSVFASHTAGASLL